MFDLETFFDELEDFMKSNLNNSIAAINTEKSDSIVLKTIDDNAYTLQTLDERVVNYDPFVFYGMAADAEVLPTGPYTARIIKADIAIVAADENNPNIGKRFFRYARALEEIFLNNWNSIGNLGIKFKVSNPFLFEFELLNTTQTFRAVGVQLEAAIA